MQRRRADCLGFGGREAHQISDTRDQVLLKLVQYTVGQRHAPHQGHQLQPLVGRKPAPKRRNEFLQYPTFPDPSGPRER